MLAVHAYRGIGRSFWRRLSSRKFYQSIHVRGVSREYASQMKIDERPEIHLKRSRLFGHVEIRSAHSCSDWRARAQLSLSLPNQHQPSFLVPHHLRPRIQCAANPDLFIECLLEGDRCAFSTWQSPYGAPRIQYVKGEPVGAASKYGSVAHYQLTISICPRAVVREGEGSWLGMGRVSCRCGAS
jgi:hypothetical protein